MALNALTPEQLWQKLQDAEEREQQTAKKLQEANEREHQKAKELQKANERRSKFDTGLSKLAILPQQKVAAIQNNCVTGGPFIVHVSPHSRLFPMNLQSQKLEHLQFYMTDAQRFMSYCLLDDEVALVSYEQRTVEELVISTWQQKGSDRIGFKSCQDHSLDDVTSRLGQMNTGSRTARPTTPTKRLYDKLCHITIGKAPRRDLFVIEYKAADKLTPDLVLEGLHDMDIDAIIQRIKVSTDRDKRRKEIAEEVIAIVVTQTFDYMVDLGFSYGYIIG